MKITGNVSLVLHAHLPYVHDLEDPHALEHRWLFEALTECYLPLIEVFQRLRDDKIPFRITFSLSPTLTTMLQDPYLQDLYDNHIKNLLKLIDHEESLAENSPELLSLILFYKERITRLFALYHKYDRNLLVAFIELEKQGLLEIITCGATHAFMPYLQTQEAMRLQVLTALQNYRSLFGAYPKGYWLPECGYTDSVAELLHEYGIQYTFVGASAFQGAVPQTPFGAFSPVITPQGIAAFTGDQALATQVWSSIQGYPGDPDYREYYRDVGFDAQESYIAPFIHPEGIRVATGLKYFRVTGSTKEKQYYDVEKAKRKVQEHAEHFVARCKERIQFAQQAIGRNGCLTIPFDAELFGHWWFEGPDFIEAVLREFALQKEINVASPADYLMQYQDFPMSHLPFSTWGRHGYGEVWMNETNHWIYPLLHDMEGKMQHLVALNYVEQANTPVTRAVLQAAKELMLAQASDWAFMMDGKDNAPYATRRILAHMDHFNHLYNGILQHDIDDAYLTRLESLNQLFANLDLAPYASLPTNNHLPQSHNASSSRLRVLMLSWEFPPMVIGGLSRHVYDLSRFMVHHDCEVHIITTDSGQAPAYEIVEGVHVHRVTVLRPDGEEFIHWTLALNLAMVQKVEELMTQQQMTFDVLHAHDWLVTYAAKALKEEYHLPLVTTIHATEHGRNQGIHNELQHQISSLEWEVAFEASHVIVCSEAMKDEMANVYSVPMDKLTVIANGLDKSTVKPLTSAPKQHVPFVEQDDVLVFVGRLVREKGVETLLYALPEVLQKHPNAKLVVMGKGPMMEPWKQLAFSLGIAHRVEFTGFVSDAMRDAILSSAKAAVFPSWYEPFGIVALEAMAMHLPIIVSDTGGLADVVTHRVNGLKAIVGHAHSLAEQIDYLLANPAEAKRFAQRAYQDLDHYDWHLIVDQTVDMYRKAMQVASQTTIA
nr:DUF1957 domain-containing protein [Bacilli bacterium]